MARESRAVWAKRVERWRDSGLSADEFAQEVGVNANTLAGWRWRFGAEARSPAVAAKRTDEDSIDFVELIQPPAAPIECFDVVTQNGRTVRVPVRFDAEALARLLAVVERA